MTSTPEKMSGTSLDIAADQRARLKQLFPTVITETVNEAGKLVESVDFEKLKAELGTFTDLFENRRERYGMDWPGKKEALKLIQTISTATLKPCREESVNFDSTENLFIDHIEPKAGPEDLLYEILIKAGFPPSERIESQTLAGKTVYSIAGGGLLLCLEDEVSAKLINAVAEAEPMQFICLDAAFGGNDQLKANAVQTFAARNMGKEKHNQIVFKTV